ncbi:PREDICTED: peroxisomal N(1)-acetyl-spermine/spermidine oxidase-like [Priapulus caudatus]|uniref:Peroxisomal N(1)-acetyl-spermine/spermidine oxidase-like n=1 Tax=Priapulus caudatus TaxID=37621 RepID=A0ABM1EB10_PRICU|nr:PREDICTED: peroxisomal N(1)-acetyl-spermine/spermidine oxidase-like [Priapulus caudatus]XP_014669382.1 PREDICTED: peroxisomal N(1)-acetyl-spermine/spermidine oxidase-like [Priapulus caudatus]
MAMTKRTVIVGAGIAGLGAAQRLLKAGVSDIIILEAGDRIGGRICSFPYGNGFIDYGAQWIHGEDGNPVYTIAKKHGLLRQPDCQDTILPEMSRHLWREEENDILLTAQGEQMPEEVVHGALQILDDIMRNMKNLTTDNHDFTSVGDYTHRHFVAKIDELDWSEIDKARYLAVYRSLRLVEMIDAGESQNMMDIAGWNQYHTCPGDIYVELANGFSSILQVILNDIPDGTIKLGTPVVKVQLTDGSTEPVTVTTANGAQFQAAHVIITSSLGSLKAASSTMFEPPLPPGKLRAIHRLGFSTMNKIHLQFQEPFWEKNVNGLQFIPEEGAETDLQDENQSMSEIWHKAITGFDVHPAKTGLLVGFLAGKAAEYMETLDDAVVVNACMAKIRQYLKNDTLPEPTKIICSTWHSAPYMMGSYSNIPVSASIDDPSTLAEPVPSEEEPRLMFAGEATHATFYSTSHGALLSGQREADRIIAFLSHQ